MAHTGALAYPTGDDAIGVGPHRGAELPSNLNAVLVGQPPWRGGLMASSQTFG
jgi:hypothetical protein